MPLRLALWVMAGLTAFGIATSAGAGSASASKPSTWWGPGTRATPDTGAGAGPVVVQDGYAARTGIPVRGGRNYRVAMDIAGPDVVPGAVAVQVSFRGPGVDPGWYGPVATGPDHGDERALMVPVVGREARSFAAVIPAPPAADEMILYLRKHGTAGAPAAFSRVSVALTDEAPTTRAGAAREEAVARAFGRGACAPDRQAALARLSALGRSGPPPGSAHRVAVGGRGAMRVHVGRDEDVITLSAAEDLAGYLGRITGGAFGPMSDDCRPGSLPMFVVGRNNALARSLLDPSEFDGLGEDGFVVRSSGAHVLIAGATPRGTMYGVNWLLDRTFGVHWLAPGHTVVPRSPTLRLPVQAVRQSPRFAYREVLSVEAQDKAWRARNLMNGESHGPSFTPSPPAIDSWRHDWNARGTVATFYDLLPPERFAASHPGWYAGGQLAMMDPALRAAMAEAVIARLRTDPAAADGWFAIHDMDRGWDMDPASRAFADRHGGRPSAPRLDMMIDVADRVRTVLPEARFAFNAYHWSFAPPPGMTVPDHILVYPMDIHLDFGRPIGSGADAQAADDIRGWAAIAKSIVFWDHITDFAGFLQPTPNIHAIAGNIAWLAALPQVRGYFAEGSWDTPGAEFAALRAWMIARLLWDPAEDPDAIVAAFCDGYYGPASGAVQSYIALERRALVRSGDLLGEKAQVDLGMFDADFLRSADALFDEAERAANGTPFAEAVAEARLPVDYVAVLRRGDLAVAAAQGRWTPDMDRRLPRFWATIARSKVTHYMQGGDVAQLRALAAIERTPAAAPSIVQPGDRWVDIQDLGLNRYDGVPIVADAAASDHAAIAIGPLASGWDVQLKLDKLPPDGLWWLYASVRGDATGAAGVKVGAYPPSDCFDVFPGPSLSPTAYRWVEVPGGPFTHGTDHGTGIYVQATGASGRGDVRLDRIIAVDRRLDTPVRTTAPSHACGIRTRTP